MEDQGIDDRAEDGREDWKGGRCKRREMAKREVLEGKSDEDEKRRFVKERNLIGER